MTLPELLITLLLSSVLTLACIEWFMAMSRFSIVQASYVEASEVGRFATSYLTKSLQKSGAGIDGSENRDMGFGDNFISIRYARELPAIGVVRNCLGNKSRSHIIENRYSAEAYQHGGYELKCVSSGLGDWLTEGIEYMGYQLVVDQGRFDADGFNWGDYDLVPDAYISPDEFDPITMKLLALRVTVEAYRPLESKSFSVNYWGAADSVRNRFYAYVSLPNQR